MNWPSLQFPIELLPWLVITHPGQKSQLYQVSSLWMFKRARTRTEYDLTVVCFVRKSRAATGAKSRFAQCASLACARLPHSGNGTRSPLAEAGGVVTTEHAKNQSIYHSSIPYL